MFGFEKLQVWNKAVDFANAIYDVTATFPDDEKFGLRSQMRRAAISISSNIAEGSGRATNRDFRRFVEIAYGSLMETISQLLIAGRRRYIERESVVKVYGEGEELARMLSGLRASLFRDKEPPKDSSDS
jgi:four helix bundle protein